MTFAAYTSQFPQKLIAKMLVSQMMNGRGTVLTAPFTPAAAPFKDLFPLARPGLALEIFVVFFAVLFVSFFGEHDVFLSRDGPLLLVVFMPVANSLHIDFRRRRASHRLRQSVGKQPAAFLALMAELAR